MSLSAPAPSLSAPTKRPKRFPPRLTAEACTAQGRRVPGPAPAGRVGLVCDASREQVQAAGRQVPAGARRDRARCET
eukprot:282576-Rhodomonas_salina.1